VPQISGIILSYAASIRQGVFPLNTLTRLLLISLLLLIPSSVFAQAGAKPAVENNLYYRALFASLDKMAKSWGNGDDSVRGSRVRTDHHNMVVERNRDITEGLPSQLGEYRVEYLDSQGLVGRYKKLRKPFAILITRPLQNDGERLNVTFTVYWFSYGKGSLNYGLSDWSDVYFRFDCEKREYVIDEVKLRGI
jgi:hypothetical protein